MRHHSLGVNSYNQCPMNLIGLILCRAEVAGSHKLFQRTGVSLFYLCCRPLGFDRHFALSL